MSNEELIAEARTPGYESEHDEAWGSNGRSPADRSDLVRRLADALEAQSAPLVADSKDAIVKELTRNQNGCDDSALMSSTFLAESVADALLSSGVVSLAADRDRAVAERAWDEGARFFDDDPLALTYNPYRESEARND